jgi:DNA repair protein SbcD/Mre11
MKLLHTGDLHIGMINYSKLDPVTGLESRLLDFFNTFDFIIEKAIEEKVDVFLFCGDAYKTRDPSPTQQRGFGERIKKIAKSGIPVVMVVGNHDTPNAQGKANTLDIYSALEIDNVFVSRKPELLNIKTKSGNLQVITAPWLQKGDFKDLGEKLSLLYQKIDISLTGGPAILAGHLEVEGSLFGSEKGLSIANDVTVPISLLTDRKLSYVALGHIHKFQELSKNPSVIYSGSPERIDFGEEKDEKGFVLIDIPVKSHKPEDISYQFIKTPARKFVSISVALKADDENPTKTILDEIKKFQIKEAIVKVIINIPADLNKEIEMDLIKKALSEANYIAGISRNIERVDRKILEGTDEVERLTPIEALEKYFQAKKYSTEKIKELTKYAEKIFRE